MNWWLDLQRAVYEGLGVQTTASLCSVAVFFLILSLFSIEFEANLMEIHVGELHERIVEAACLKNSCLLGQEFFVVDTTDSQDIPNERWIQTAGT